MDENFTLLSKVPKKICVSHIFNLLFLLKTIHVHQAFYGQGGITNEEKRSHIIQAVLIGFLSGLVSILSSICWVGTAI